MAKKWYVIHVFSGSEKKVCQSIEEQITAKNMEALIEEVLVPTEEVVEIRRGAKVQTEKKFFPGYILIKMEMTDETWHLIKAQSKVTGFLGTKGKPIAISNAEAKRLIEGGGIKIEDNPIKDTNLIIDKSYDKKILKIGKKKYFKIIIS